MKHDVAILGKIKSRKYVFNKIIQTVKYINIHTRLHLEPLRLHVIVGSTHTVLEGSWVQFQLRPSWILLPGHFMESLNCHLGCITASSQGPAGIDSRTLVTLIRKQKMDDGQGVFLSFSWGFPQG